LLLLGVFDLGRAVFYYSNLSNAAREGARYGAVNPEDPDGIKAAVCRLSAGIELGCPAPATEVCGTGLDPAVACVDPQPTLRIATEPNAVTNDDYIHIHLVYHFRPVTPLIALFIEGNQIELDIESRMRIEG
jgi:hypothetical protein